MKTNFIKRINEIKLLQQTNVIKPFCIWPFAG